MQEVFARLSPSEIENMIDLLIQWVNINTFSYNTQGLNMLAPHLIQAFSELKPDKVNIIPFRTGPGLHFIKRPKNPLRIYLGGHYDTVFSPTNPFQKAHLVDKYKLQGPGVADMKGGLVVLLKALEIFEKSRAARTLGWDIFLNPDEEIGSPHSTKIIKQIGKKCLYALLFEPALDNGYLVSTRMGSANYLAETHGIAAHVGRAPKKGKNAIYPLARWITEIEHYHAPKQGIILNVGKIEGGETANKVPDSATCLVNVRADTDELMDTIHHSLMHSAKNCGVKLTQQTFRPPKPFIQETQALFNMLKKTAQTMGMNLKWKKTGGVCDGNTLGALGVPTIDNLGVHGGGLHTQQEWMDIRSLKSQVLLVSQFLMDLANNEEPQC